MRNLVKMAIGVEVITNEGGGGRSEKTVAVLGS